MFSGMLPFFKKAETNITGMPAFFNVFKSFLEDKNVNEVLFIQLIDIKKYGEVYRKITGNVCQ
ncbi:MAG: hypothetical protein MZV64_15655 [Ignavibacteriales bacterium]|nr:hypothetical protein [Ignavibacteriales bacterium]